MEHREPSTSKPVFLSYATEDTAVGETIRAALEERDIRCWMAPRDIVPGLEYGGQIIRAIEGCTVLLLLLSASSNSSRFVLHEVERAVSKDKIIIPVRIEDVPPSRSLEFFISNAQWVEAWQPPVTEQLAQIVTALAGAIHNHLAAPATAPVESAPTSAPTPSPAAIPDSSAHARRTNLPTSSTPFVGRATEVAEIEHQLMEPSCRLLTITGLGGMGKTRLAIEVGTRLLDHFADGVWFVPLASVSQADLLPSTVAAALDIPNLGSGDTLVHLLHNLIDKSLLLILDNYEQLLADTSLIAGLLEATPGVRLLVTSRERLQLEQEWLFPLEGLAVPSRTGASVDSLANSAAVQLFVRCAKRLRPDFALSDANAADVVRICRLVGGMPLGIEMAASWLRTVPLAEIAAEIQQSLDFLASSLRNAPAHHRNMRAVFDRSWQWLATDEQQTLQRVTIFAGGFTRTAARAVAGASLPILARLVDSSWLQMDERGRYEIHELARQYAREKVEQDPATTATIRSAHSRYFGHFAASQREPLQGDDPALAQDVLLADIDLDALSADIDNLRLGWKWALETGAWDTLANYIGALTLVADARGYYGEMIQRFEQAADALRHQMASQPDGHSLAPDAPTPTLVLAQLRYESAFLSARAISVDRGVELATEAVSLLRPVHNHDGRHAAAYTRAMMVMATTVAMQGDLSSDDAIWQELEQISDERSTTRRLFLLGHKRHYQGRYVEADQFLTDCLEQFAEVGMATQRAVALDRRALVLCHMGHLDEAWPLAVESARILAQIGHKVSTASAVLAQAEIALARQDFAQAGALLEQSEVLGRETGNEYVRVRFCRGRGQLERLQGRPAAARSYFRQAHDLAERMGRQRDRIEMVLGLGLVALDLGEWREARPLLRRSLQEAWTPGLTPLALGAVMGWATLHARDGHGQEAAYWLAVVLHHPATSIFVKQEAEQRQGQIAAKLTDTPEAELALYAPDTDDPQSTLEAIVTDLSQTGDA